MKKNILTLLLTLSFSALFAQEAKFSFEPKPFHHTILLTTHLKESQDISIQFFNDKNEMVKEMNYTNISNSRFKVDVKNLTAGNNYTVKVFSASGTLLYTEKLHKSINAKK